MTIPRGVGATVGRVSDMVRDSFVRMRSPTMSQDEMRVGIHLRGNPELREALISVVESRIRSRASLPVPSDPIICKAILERDKELRWLISRIEAIYDSPVMQGEEQQREQPA